jgi:beta-lactam-binding protein with PASTA domain
MRARRVPPDERDIDPAARTTVVEEDGAPPPVVEEEEVVPVRRGPRPPELWPWLLLLLLLVAGGLAAAWYFTRDNGNGNNRPAAVSSATVPNVVGEKQADARQRLEQRGLHPQFLTRASKFPKGTVFAQKPAAGAEVARGATVLLSVSAVAVTNVPNVVGMKSAAAVKTLKAAGFDAQTVSVSGTQAAGTVISQTPAAGQRVGKGSTVTLKVSRGAATVPDVVGQQASDAKSALGAAGLKTSVFQVPSAQSKGTVVAQSPAAGKKVSRGSAVRINVSNGSQTPPPPPPPSGGTTTTSAPATARVPDVVGVQQGPAQRRLQSAGFRARILYVASQSPAGEVVSEAPSAGTTAKRGSRVTLRVSVGPAAQTTAVPDVVGDDQQAATTTLQNAGFTVQVLQVPVTDPSQDGTVVDEQPAGGARAPNGSQVTIYVGKTG